MKTIMMYTLALSFIIGGGFYVAHQADVKKRTEVRGSEGYRSGRPR